MHVMEDTSTGVCVCGGGGVYTGAVLVCCIGGPVDGSTMLPCVGHCMMASE